MKLSFVTFSPNPPLSGGPAGPEVESAGDSSENRMKSGHAQSQTVQGYGLIERKSIARRCSKFASNLTHRPLTAPG